MNNKLYVSLQIALPFILIAIIPDGEVWRNIGIAVVTVAWMYLANELGEVKQKLDKA